jgi:hypothetical protein
MSILEQSSESLLSNVNKPKPSINDGSKVIKQVESLNQSNLAKTPNANTDQNYTKKVFDLSII